MDYSRYYKCHYTDSANSPDEITTTSSDKDLIIPDFTKMAPYEVSVKKTKDIEERLTKLESALEILIGKFIEKGQDINKKKEGEDESKI